VILVTSAAPGDGKTVLASALAQTFALSNKRCLLVDADFRRPSAHRIFNKGARAGLCEVLAGTVPLEKALTRLHPDPLTFLSAGEVVSEPLELLSPKRLIPFIESVRQTFDVVILDSPPVLAVSDAGIISAQVTNVLLAVRWAVTTRSATSRALTILRRHGGPTPVAALTNVDHRKTSKFEDGRYGMDLSYGGRSWVHGSRSAERRAG
jgi:capsular exopolysaccharide synthesis family protein